VYDGTLILSFSETVNVSSFDPSAVTLQNQQDRATAGQIVILTDGFQCNPSERDLKTFTDLGTSDSENTLLLGAYFLCVGIYVHPLNNVQLQYLDDPKRAVKLEAAHVFSIISHS